MLPCIVAQLPLSMDVTLSQVLNTNLAFWKTTFVAFLTSLCMCFYHFLIKLDKTIFLGVDQEVSRIQTNVENPHIFSQAYLNSRGYKLCPIK
jgi:hypothetical protein